MRVVPPILLAAAMLLPGCAASSPPPAAGTGSPSYDAAYQQGVAAAEQELREGNPTIYVAGLLQTGRHPETGLPYRSVAGCTLLGAEAAFIGGHNDTIRSRARPCLRGLPAAHSAAEPCTTAPTSSPNGASPNR